MSEEAFKAIIAAQDQTAATFEAIIARLKKVEHAADGATKHTKHLNEHTKAPLGELKEHLGEIGEKFDGVKEHADGLLDKVLELFPALSALGAAGSLVGLFELTEKAAEGFSKLNAEAKKTGITRAELAALRYAAQQADVPVDALASGLEKLNLAVAGAKSGKNKDALALFQHLHVDPRGIKSAADILPRLAEAFEKTADPSMRARAARALFGKGGVEMLPLLMQGRKELEEAAKRGRELKYAPNDEQAEALERYHHAQIDLNTAVSAFTFEVGSKLAPVLSPVIEQVERWVTANRDWVSTNISERVERMAKAAEKFVEETDWEAVKARLKEIAERVQSVADAVNGWINVGEIVLAFYAGRFVIGMLASIGKVAVALYELPAKAIEATEAANVALAKVHAGSKLGTAARVASGGVLGYMLADTVDPEDRLGNFIDKHVPGASFVDNLFSHVGLGRSYEEQESYGQPIPALAGPPAAAPAVLGQAPPQQGSVDVRVTIDGAPFGTRAEAVSDGIANVAPPDVGYAMGDGRD